MRRWVVLLIVFLLLFSLSEGTVWGEENLIPNPSFEKDNDSNRRVDGWRWRITSAGAAGNCIGRWEKEGHSGRRAIFIDEERWFSSSEWITKVGRIVPRTWYVLSLWTKRDRATGWLPKIVLFGEERCVNIRKVGEWKRFDWIINSGNYSGAVELKMAVYKKPYKVWFDDVRLERFDIELSSPADESLVKNRLVKFCWVVPQTKSLLNYTLEFSPDRNFLSTVKSVKGIRKKSYSPSQELSPGQWFWRVKAYKNDVELAISKVGEFIVVGEHAPEVSHCWKGKGVWVGKDGFLQVRGKPFFPVGIYGPPAGAFREIKNAGFNVVVTDSDLDAAGRAGLKVIVPFKPRMNLKDVVRNPALLSWYIWDEPGQHNIPPGKILERHLEIKKVDPFHPTAVVIYYPENYWTYASVSDIFMVDPYPVPHRPMTVVSDSVEAARKAVADKKPVWAIIQAFDWKECSAEARRVGTARLPTYEEERYMAFLAIVHGAKGILFYRYNRGDAHDFEHWKGLKRLARELARVSYIFLSPDGGSKILVNTDKLDVNGNSAIHCLMKESKKRKYFIAVNVLNESVTATFTQLSAGCRLKRVLYGRGDINVEKGEFTDSFSAYGVHIYSIRKG